MKNLFSNIPAELRDELITTLVEADARRVERIVSHGHASPAGFWYDQDHYEWVIVLKGAARLQIEGCAELLDMKPGDYVNLPAHQRHRVDWTTTEEPTIWLAIHYRGASSPGAAGRS